MNQIGPNLNPAKSPDTTPIETYSNQRDDSDKEEADQDSDLQVAAIELSVPSKLRAF